MRGVGANIVSWARCIAIMAGFLASIMPSPAGATRLAITQLGRAPVAGKLASTAALKAHRVEILRAAVKLHLSARAFDALRAALGTSDRLQYGLLPRRLDAMASGPAPYHVLYHVLIPGHQFGWHIRVVGRVRTLDLYIPAACGNLSFVRSRRLAVRPSDVHPLPTFRVPAPAVKHELLAPSQISASRLMRVQAPSLLAPGPLPAVSTGASGLCKRGIARDICWFVPLCLVGMVAGAGFHAFCGLGPRLTGAPAPISQRGCLNAALLPGPANRALQFMLTARL